MFVAWSGQKERSGQNKTMLNKKPISWIWRMRDREDNNFKLLPRAEVYPPVKWGKEGLGDQNFVLGHVKFDVPSVHPSGVKQVAIQGWCSEARLGGYTTGCHRY